MYQTFTFADRLKSAMEQKHMKQVDLIHAAETAGVKVGKSHISQYVSGKTVPCCDSCPKRRTGNPDLCP